MLQETVRIHKYRYTQRRMNLATDHSYSAGLLKNPLPMLRGCVYAGKIPCRTSRQSLDSDGTAPTAGPFCPLTVGVGVRMIHNLW